MVTKDYDFGELNELLQEYNKIEKLKQDRISEREEYTYKNIMNERKQGRLLAAKEQLEYLKEILLSDLRKNIVIAEKRKIILSRKTREFQLKNETLQFNKLPLMAQLQKLMDVNERLAVEEMCFLEVFDNLKKEYVEIFCSLESDLYKKIIEFSKEVFKVKQYSLAIS